MATAPMVQMKRRREAGGSKYWQIAMNTDSAGCVCVCDVALKDA